MATQRKYHQNVESKWSSIYITTYFWKIKLLRNIMPWNLFGDRFEHVLCCHKSFKQYTKNYIILLENFLKLSQNCVSLTKCSRKTRLEQLNVSQSRHGGKASQNPNWNTLGRRYAELRRNARYIKGVDGCGSLWSPAGG